MKTAIYKRLCGFDWKKKKTVEILLKEHFSDVSTNKADSWPLP